MEGGVFLLAFAPLCFGRRRSLRRRKGNQRVSRAGLLEDVSQAVEEVANTAEDALVHVPWCLTVGSCMIGLLDGRRFVNKWMDGHLDS